MTVIKDISKGFEVKQEQWQVGRILIEEIANDPETPWEDCDEDDVNYITLWLSMWGITSARNF